MSYLFTAVIGNLQAFDGYSATPFWVVLLIIIILLLFFWYGQNRVVSDASADHGHGEDTHGAHDHGEVQAHFDHHDDEETDHGAMGSRTAVLDVPIEPEPEPEPIVAVEPDNLKTVEGIGPKIEGILHEAGIRTFADLAAASVPQLEKIVREDAGIRVAYPDTWPEQAALAAKADWDGLEKLQDELKGGRRR